MPLLTIDRSKLHKYIYILAILIPVFGLVKASISSYVSFGFSNVFQFSFYYLISATVWLMIIPLFILLLRRYYRNSELSIKQVLELTGITLGVAISQRIIALSLDFSLRHIVTIYSKDKTFALKDGIIDTLLQVKHVLVSSSMENFIILGLGLALYFSLLKKKSTPTTLKLSDGTVLRLEDIELISARRNYVEIITPEGNFLSRTPLTRLLSSLCDDFIRVHRSHIIRKSAIRSMVPLYYQSFKIKTTSGKLVTTSPKYYREVVRLS